MWMITPTFVHETTVERQLSGLWLELLDKSESYSVIRDREKQCSDIKKNR